MWKYQYRNKPVVANFGSWFPWGELQAKSFIDPSLEGCPVVNTGKKYTVQVEDCDIRRALAF